MEDQESEQLERLYCEMYDRLFCYANAVLSDPLRAEEAVQETFRIACGKHSAVLKSENPQGWLVNALKGVLRNFSRKDARYNRLFVPFQDEHDGERSVELSLELLYQDIAETREYKLLMKLAEGGSVRELAKGMGISENACKKRIQRSRQYLKTRMAKGQ